MAVALALAAATASGRSPIRLADDPTLSPDGQTLVFSWRGDLWSVATTGGVARAMTQNPARDWHPVFSPDGRQIAFLSEREPGPQVCLMPAGGGTPRVVTAHSEGYMLDGWYPDGSALLVNAVRDYFTSPRATQRLFRVPLEPSGGEQVLFDDYGRDGAISPDGRRLLFTREGEEWWRKGYRGSRACQIWSYDLDTREFQMLVREGASARWPLWRPDGRGFYFVSARGGSFNLWECDLTARQTNQLTRFEDDSVAFPCLSRDGQTIVFRHLFDLYRLHPGKGAPVRIDIEEDADAGRSTKERRTLNQATEVAFSADGLEAAFIAGGDLWVMDTDLREPRQITRTPEEERNPSFAPDGQAILFTSDQGGQCDIWRARRARADQFWWQNERFELERLTDDPAVEQELQWSPDGSRVAFSKGLGDLYAMDAAGGPPRRILSSWNEPDYQWSPDSKWFVVAKEDDDFNSDIWILPSDGSGQPVNISKHPDNESSPTWSPDGKIVAFTGRRQDTEVDIFYVWLNTEEDARTRRDRTMERAIEKINKVRNKEKEKEKPTKKPEPAVGRAGEGGPAETDPTTRSEKTEEPKIDLAKPDAKAPGTEAREESARKPRKVPIVTIDFDRIHERVRQISIPNSAESSLVWSHDSKKLAFTATLDGKRGTYTVEFPDELKPKLLSTETGSQGRWIETGNQIVWLASGGRADPTGGPPEDAPPRGPGGVPASLSDAGKSTNYSFRSQHEIDLPEKFRAAFDLAWRTMRDRWYDERLGNRNWDEIRRKYREAAAAAPDVRSLGTVVSLMLGELNGSHLGFSPNTSRTDDDGPADGWQPVTAHLGVRWDFDHRGPGLKIRDVLANGPADRKTNGLAAGELVLSIDGRAVDPGADLPRLLNGPLNRDVRLRVRDRAGDERDVVLRPIAFGRVRPLLYEAWIRDKRSAVERRSQNTLGYLHVEGMNWPSFQKFERDLYAAGSGKDGLIIDVRDNGGGFTADHLLTALTQPRHAITVPRGGGPGYPQDRQVYATWNKPVVVLCNQNSFSNAEIFSHAIKTLNRGKLVGVTTAGGVVSTGGRAIMDVGFLRLPFRGWFVPGTGEDMELNGAVPDFMVWPMPGEIPAGKDEQLAKAITVLQDEVTAWKQRPPPTLRKSTERR